jgi:hypothetical protein
MSSAAMATLCEFPFVRTSINFTQPLQSGFYDFR